MTTSDDNLSDRLRIAATREHYEAIEPRILEGLSRWAVHGTIPGGFLQAVLRNDLIDAVNRADAENFLSLREIMHFVFNELPGRSWGSAATVTAWAKEKLEETARAAEAGGDHV